jgi:hypothetical protein
MAFDAVLADPGRLFAILNELDSAGLGLTRLDDVEPARKVYSEATVTELLTIPPVTRELPCRNLLAVGERSQVGVRACVPVAPGRGSANVVDVSVKRARQRDLGLLTGFFDGDFFIRHRVAYAVLDTWPEFFRQHVRGTINDRLPGVFWLNWLSDRYVEVIGEEALLGLPWFKTARTPGGLACWLYQELSDVPADRADRVGRFESILGSEKFVMNGWKNLPQLAVSAG